MFTHFCAIPKMQFLGQFSLEDEHELESRIVPIRYISADDFLFVSSRYYILRVWRWNQISLSSGVVCTSKKWLIDWASSGNGIQNTGNCQPRGVKRVEKILLCERIWFCIIITIANIRWIMFVKASSEPFKLEIKNKFKRETRWLFT